MQRKKFTLPLGLLLLFINITADCQVMMKRTLKGDFFSIPEVGAFIAQKDKSVVIDMLMPADRRPEGYKTIDLKEGDVIMMANARKISSVNDLKKIYDNLTVGSDLKLALTRGEERLMATIKKADPDKLPKRQEIKISGGNKDAKLMPVMDLGLLIEDMKGKLNVRALFPEGPAFIKESGIKENDQIIALNGETLKSADELTSRLEKIKTGDELTLKFKHGDQEKTCKGKKPVSKGKVKVEGRN